MRTKQSVFAVLLSLTTVFATACDDSPTGNTGDPATPEEAEFLVNLFIETLSAGTGDIGEEEEFSGSFDVTESCESGALAVEGDYEGTQNAAEEEIAISISLDYTVDFLNCFFTLDEGEITLDGDPRVTISVDASQVGTFTTYDIDIDGAVSFETDDERTGRCAMNLNLDIEDDFDDEEDPDISISGSICGVSGSELVLDLT